MRAGGTYSTSYLADVSTTLLFELWEFVFLVPLVSYAPSCFGNKFSDYPVYCTPQFTSHFYRIELNANNQPVPSGVSPLVTRAMRRRQYVVSYVPSGF